MSPALLQRLGSAFVEPGQGVSSRANDLASLAPLSVGVLCGGRAGLAPGAAIALVLRRRVRASAALVLHWGAPSGGELSPRAPALVGARRLAGSLRARGHRAWASGRLAFVALPDDPVEAASGAGRAAGAAGDAPCVLVVAGPRPAPIESLLELQDGVVVLAPDDDAGGLATLATAGLSQRGLESGVLDATLSSLARVAAVGGLWLPPRARRAVTAALWELP